MCKVRFPCRIGHKLSNSLNAQSANSLALFEPPQSVLPNQAVHRLRIVFRHKKAVNPSLDEHDTMRQRDLGAIQIPD